MCGVFNRHPRTGCDSSSTTRALLCTQAFFVPTARSAGAAVMWLVEISVSRENEF